LIPDYLIVPGGGGTLLFVALTLIFIVILSGCSCAKRLVNAGIDKMPETPRTRILMAALTTIVL
jgi:hypothetical protein